MGTRMTLHRHYLIDASALVPFFLPEAGKPRAAITRLLRLRDKGRANLYVPNFCMAECSRAIAELTCKEDAASDDSVGVYRGIMDELVDLVSRRRQGLIRSLELRRPHLVDIETIYIAQWRNPPRDPKQALSGVDGLVLAMAKRLMEEYDREHVRVVTARAAVARMCRETPELLPPAVYTPKDPISEPLRRP
ncbi:MAG: hypothetical protein HY926_12315 [Elusimicrobia bacterium]|nr:hypothetical protein [Elusimicrobiota bacterium]